MMGYEEQYEEFLDRGISDGEAQRLAEEVVARDPSSSCPPLELSPTEATLYAEREAERLAADAVAASALPADEVSGV